MSYVKNFFGFRASPWGLTSGKNFMVIRPSVPEILGGVVPLLGCQKQQMLLTVKKFKQKVRALLFEGTAKFLEHAFITS